MLLIQHDLATTLACGEYLIRCAVEEAIARAEKLHSLDMEQSLLRYPLRDSTSVRSSKERRHDATLELFSGVHLSTMQQGLVKNRLAQQSLAPGQASMSPAWERLHAALGAGLLGAYPNGGLAQRDNIARQIQGDKTGL